MLRGGGGAPIAPALAVGAALWRGLTWQAEQADGEGLACVCEIADARARAAARRSALPDGALSCDVRVGVGVRRRRAVGLAVHARS